MKLALDPWMIRDRPLADMCKVASELGYEHLELSPREDFFPLYLAPRADADRVRELKDALRDSGVALASFWAVYRWSDPESEALRTASVRYWRRAIQIAVDLECAHISSEFSGDPDRPEESEAAFHRSLEEILPILESEGITMSLEAHPGDFVEESNRAVDMIRAYNSPHLRYLYCAPHTFHLAGTDGDVAGMLRYCAPVLDHVHVADTLDHRQYLRYIVNPLDSTVRIHQHLIPGEGEVPWDAFFRTLHEIGFDGILASCVFAWEDRAVEALARTRDAIRRYLDANRPAGTDPMSDGERRAY